MKLMEALRIYQRIPSSAKPFRVSLCCGFTPLHLADFLRAHIATAMPDRTVVVTTGLYDDVEGTLRGASWQELDACILALEWSDFDARLGTRRLAGWDPEILPEILADVAANADRWPRFIEPLTASMPVAVSLPTLPVPPVSFEPTWQAGHFETQIAETLARLAAGLSATRGVGVVNLGALDRVSPMASRHDLKSELSTGFPYRISHADALASLLTRLVVPRTPKKGLITDLDDTLWRGIAGDEGAENVAWDLDHHAQVHGLYQQLLRSLGQSGVLLGIASKNDPGVVERVFERPDIIAKSGDFFPVEVNWGPKSASVSRVLRSWNVTPDSVVFIDDSPMELDEVHLAHPDIECILFPKNDPDEVYRLLSRLRDLFGKVSINEEDRIRSVSLRAAARIRQDSGQSGAPVDEFLERAGGRVTFSWQKDPPDPRALELINKTNQFNLNGRRFAEAEWLAYAAQGDTRILLVQYQDKYGPLGKIAALAGRQQGARFCMDVWVMSCRAFSRRIEHRTLQEVFDKCGVQEVLLNFQANSRNAPFAGFVASLLGRPLESPCLISRQEFEKNSPALHPAEPSTLATVTPPSPTS